jgi:hypothetical protein
LVVYVQIGWRNSQSFKFGESFDRKLSTRFLHLRSHSFRLRYASGSSHFCDRFTFVEVNPSAVHWDIVDVANRVILKCQFAAFDSLVVCEFFRQTETP